MKRKITTRLSLAVLCMAVGLSISPVAHSQVINTIAGNGTAGYGGDGGAATAAKINLAGGIDMDASGNLYIADQINNRIRKVSPSGVITTIAGTGTAGYSGDGGAATAAKLYRPTDVKITASGVIYLTDYFNHCIRKITAAGIITTVAGNGSSGFSGDGGQATAARLYYPQSIVLDAAGNLIIADEANDRVRKVNSTTGIITTIAGGGSSGLGDGGQATAASLHRPGGVIFNSSGELIISDVQNERIRKIDASGIINTIAGTGSGGFSGDGGPATAAQVNHPARLAFDASGNLIFADYLNNRIRKINTSSVITTIAGTGAATFGGDGGPATAAQLYYPDAVYVDATGALYLDDAFNNRIRKIGGCTTSIAGIHGANVICPGDTLLLTDSTAGGTWTSSNTTVATVSGAGTVTGVGAGTTIISYTVTSSCGTIAATFTVVTNPAPFSGIITGPSSVCVGSGIMLVDTVTGGAWSATNSNASIVGGWVMGITPGLDTVQFTASNSCGTAVTTQVISVDAAPYAGTIGTPEGGICPGDSALLVDGAPGGVWISRDNAIATVAGTGRVTGVAGGIDTIMYIVTNSCGSDTAFTTVLIRSAAQCNTGVAVLHQGTATLNAYPDPSNGNFTVTLSSPTNDAAQLVVTNILGQKINQQSIIPNKPADVQLHVPAGVYFLSVLSGGERVSVKVVVE